MKSKLFLFITICILGLASCGKDDPKPSCSTAYGSELQVELNAVISAGQAYGNDPSTANCTSYKAAYQAYINKLKPYGNCSALTVQQRADFEATLEEAENDLATLC
jgi:hypothetical protein